MNRRQFPASHNRYLLVSCPMSLFTLIVIPGLTRNPVFLRWIPAFAGMTTSKWMKRSVGDTNTRPRRWLGAERGRRHAVFGGASSLT
jgi:hypothetical protein